MVNFETEVYNKQSEDIIGVKVIVVADNGQTIESIRCVNETDFQDLKSKLDVLDENYVVFASGSILKGLNLDTILANANESATINATLLGGYQSDYYAKSNHSHNKSDITGLYNYDISLSKYNVNIIDNETITVTVKVTDSSNSPVNKHTISIYKNGALWKSNVKTNVNGVYTTNFTPDDVGIVTFGVNNQKVQLNVESGWETIASLNGGTLKVNRSLKLAKFAGSKTVSFGNNTSFDLTTIPSGYRPSNTVRQLTASALGLPLILLSVHSGGKVELTTSTKSSTSRDVNWNMLWHYE